MRLPIISVLAATIAGAGCSFGESGVSPPLDQLFLPGGAAIDPEGRWMYVVNSNSDLRYNAGTVAVIDLDKAGADRRSTEWGRCPSPGFVNSSKAARRFCCRDFFDAEVLNCDEREYIDAPTTVQLGSFGSTLIVGGQPEAGANGRRIYVSVRAEPSVTFIDAVSSGDGVTLRCAGGQPGQNHLCDNTHKILGENDLRRGPRLAEEPQNLILDDKLQLLYVSHAAEAVSVVDLCPATPALVSVRSPVFDLFGQWVTSLLVTDPGNPAGEIFATGRNYYGSVGQDAAQIRSLYLRGADEPCAGEARKGIELVPGPGFFNSAFYGSGSDIRSILLADGKQRAFLLHRNAPGRENPAALVAVDRSPDARGQPNNQATAVLEICAGATEMRWHDAGRGPHIFIVCFEAGQVYVVEPDSLALTAVINTGRGPNDLAFSDKDPWAAYVTGFSDNNISVVDLQPGSRTEYKVVQRIGFPHVGTR
jgi:hypothetical protein